MLEETWKLNENDVNYYKVTVRPVNKTGRIVVFTVNFYKFAPN